MSVKINQIQKKSICSALPLKENYTIHSIDGEVVEDILDLMFLTQKNRFTIFYTDEHNQRLSCNAINNFDKPLGIEVVLPECESCINDCIFCFVDQMPPKLRKSLYVKDDDFLYSFFYGNFITLTNLSQKNINKIIKQHISPLYISIHTTDKILHKNMLRYNINFDIQDILKIFNDSGIEMHTQIVLIPEINDKENLINTLNYLSNLNNVSSIGIVPVGLTKYRENLERIRNFTKPEVISLISDINLYKQEKKIDYIYFADEFYILAEHPFPKDEEYNDYEQIENGIGMVRKMRENWKRNKRKIINHLKSIDGEPVFITSVSGYYAIKKIMEKENFKYQIIKNKLFGETVTVTGLLCWTDIKNQLILKDNEYPVFSSAIFNFEMNTIDDFNISQIKHDLKKEIVVIDELMDNVL